MRLELSLEKGRIRDEQSAQELKIKEADSKIDTEVSTLRTQMETIQWELFKTLFREFLLFGFCYSTETCVVQVAISVLLLTSP